MIEKLTAEQEALIPVIREKWTDLSYKPIDKYYAERIIEFLYSSIGLPLPTIVYCKSPLACQLKANIQVGRVKKFTTEDVDNDINIIKKITERLEYYPFCLYGSITDYAWLAFYDYFNQIGITYEVQDKFDRMKEILDSNIYDMLQFDTHCFVCSKPKYVHRDSNDRLHCVTGAAIEFEDGYKQYYLHGISVDKDIIIDKNNYDLTKIIQEENAEKRWRLFEHFGIDKVLSFAKSKIIEQISITKLYENNKVGNYIQHGDVIIKPGTISECEPCNLNADVQYELLELSFPEIEGGFTGRYLKMTNPSTGIQHIEGVPNSINSVADAIFWRNGIIYLPYKIS